MRAPPGKLGGASVPGRLHPTAHTKIMRSSRLQPLGVLALIALVAEAQGAGSGLGLKLDRAMQTPAAGSEERVPVFIDADELQGRPDNEVEGRGNVRLRTRGKALASDWLLYQSTLDEVDAAGNVRLEQRGDVFEGTRLKLHVETDRGFM